MKSLVLASVLGSLVGAAALGGPFHFQITRPHGLFGMLNATVGGGNATANLGQLPLDYVITDVVVDGGWTEVYVTVNGSNVAALRAIGIGSTGGADPLHLNSGILVPAGSAISVVGVGSYGIQSKGVTVSGYVQ